LRRDDVEAPEPAVRGASGDVIAIRERVVLDHLEGDVETKAVVLAVRSDEARPQSAILEDGLRLQHAPGLVNPEAPARENRAAVGRLHDARARALLVIDNPGVRAERGVFSADRETESGLLRPIEEREREKRHVDVALDFSDVVARALLQDLLRP